MYSLINLVSEFPQSGNVGAFSLKQLRTTTRERQQKRVPRGYWFQSPNWSRGACPSIFGCTCSHLALASMRFYPDRNPISNHPHHLRWYTNHPIEKNKHGKCNQNVKCIRNLVTLQKNTGHSEIHTVKVRINKPNAVLEEDATIHGTTAMRSSTALIT